MRKSGSFGGYEKWKTDSKKDLLRQGVVRGLSRAVPQEAYSPYSTQVDANPPDDLYR
ncbi:unnamed protein product, partial [marine sediment metagenome]